MSEAMKQIDLVIPKRLYLGHLSVTVVSEELAKNGLSNVMDFLIREPESVKRFYIILAKNSKAGDILKILSPLESFPSQGIYQNIRISSESQAISLAIPYSDFVRGVITKGYNVVLPSIEVIGNVEEGSKDDSLKSSEQQAMLQISTTGLFRNEKLVGYADEDASRGISILENKVNQMVITVKCNNGKAVANIGQLKTKKDVSKEEAKIKVTGNAYLKDVNCNIDLTKPEVIENLQNKFEDRIKEMSNQAIEKAKDLKTDIFGFGNSIYKAHPKYFNEIKDRWNTELFPNYRTNVSANIKLISKGSTEETIKEAIDEK